MAESEAFIHDRVLPVLMNDVTEMTQKQTNGTLEIERDDNEECELWLDGSCV
jgi:hypothetical protein